MECIQVAPKEASTIWLDGLKIHAPKLWLTANVLAIDNDRVHSLTPELTGTEGIRVECLVRHLFL
jgi:hypothetical protein